MGMLDGLDVTSDVVSDEKDTLGGGYLLESGVYDMLIEMAYFDKSKGGAKCLNISCKGDNDTNFRQTIYFTNKAGKAYYERDGKKHTLPGYNQLNALSLLSVGKEFKDLDTEEKMVNVYDYDQKKEVPMAKEVAMSLIGGKIKLGITKTIENKNTLQGNAYKPTNDKRTFNEINKVFRQSDGLTVTEIKASVSTPEFLPKWEDEWDGKDNDKFKEIAGAPAAQGSTGAPTPTASSLFTGEEAK